MLYWDNGSSRGEGYILELANAPGGLAPLDYELDADEYRGFLRAAYRRNPDAFVSLAADATRRDLTLTARDRPDLARTLYLAIVGVAEQRGWKIAGGIKG